jgi:nucleotide-binding universal stress UspA family protein
LSQEHTVRVSLGRRNSMYRRILVALDGSELAERVLPYVEPLAERFDATVVLLQATLPPTVYAVDALAAGMPVVGPVVDVTSAAAAERRTAAEYLGAIAERLGARGLAVETDQPEGPAAELLVERARVLTADLIAMTTHGRGGLGRLVFGSVADEVLRHAPCPVLLVRVSDETVRQS